MADIALRFSRSDYALERLKTQLHVIARRKEQKEHLTVNDRPTVLWSSV